MDSALPVAGSPDSGVTLTRRGRRLNSSGGTSSSCSHSSLLTNSTGYGSFPRRQAEADSGVYETNRASKSELYYSAAASSKSEGTSRSDGFARKGHSRYSNRLKSAISEAAIDSYFVKTPQFHDLEAAEVLDQTEDLGCFSDDDHDSAVLLDQVEPSVELTRQGISELADVITGLIEEMRQTSRPAIPDVTSAFKPAAIDTISKREEDKYSIASSNIYEEVLNDSERIYDLAPCVFHAPPLPRRTPSTTAIGATQRPCSASTSDLHRCGQRTRRTDGADSFLKTGASNSRLRSTISAAVFAATRPRTPTHTSTAAAANQTDSRTSSAKRSTSSHARIPDAVRVDLPRKVKTTETTGWRRNLRLLRRLLNK